MYEVSDLYADLWETTELIFKLSTKVKFHETLKAICGRNIGLRSLKFNLQIALVLNNQMYPRALLDQYYGSYERLKLYHLLLCFEKTSKVWFLNVSDIVDKHGFLWSHYVSELDIEIRRLETGLIFYENSNLKSEPFWDKIVVWSQK